jgi:mRNA interferase RelE/StbE
VEALAKADREHILNFIYLRLRRLSNPRQNGKPLEREFAGFWRYRVNDFRIVCTIDDQKSLIRIVRIGHRYDVYRPG